MTGPSGLAGRVGATSKPPGRMRQTRVLESIQRIGEPATAFSRRSTSRRAAPVAASATHGSIRSSNVMVNATWRESGDHEAFTELASASIGRLYAVAFLILRDRDRAQDAVQEALVSAWKDMRALRDPGAWDAWLYRLAVRACYRQAQKDRRRNQVELQVVPGPEPARPFDLSVSIAEREAMEYELGRLFREVETRN